MRYLYRKQCVLLRLTQPVAIDRNLDIDRIFLYVVSGLDLLVFGELCSSEASVLFQLGSTKERFIFWTWVRFDAEFYVFPLCMIFILIEEVECYSVVKRPFQQTVKRP